ncbi:MAG: phosphate acyltransferase PlsX [Actinomycetota bacterium]|nr:phosphate acyltransferase PlsX [Actinomycetota bacterium]
MVERRTARVCVDVMGGDHAPDKILEGVDDALAVDPDLVVVLTGDVGIVGPFASSRDRVEAHPTTEVIAMDEHPANSVRAKKDSSVVVGCRLVRDGEADAFFSAGSTGACMAAATLVMGRIRGVSRPAIATVIPTGGTPTVLLDVGANADCKAENLLQFAHMGSAYATTVLGLESPRVGLLNIGEEATKGSLLAQEAHALMAESVGGFAGNIEGRDVTTGVVDVIVTDGFTGNIALKLLEGLSRTLLGEVKAAMTSGVLNSLAAAVLKPSLQALRDELDPDTYGGAPLLGVNGICIIGHGSSGARAVASAIRVAAQAARGGLTERIAGAITGPS